MRCNNDKVDGYEAEVGGRTDAWATCEWKVARRDIAGFAHILLVNHKPLYGCKGWKEAFFRLMERQDGARRTALHYMGVPLLRRTQEEVGAERFSCGVAAVAWARWGMGADEVSVLGFDHFRAGQHHYMDVEARPPGCPHQGAREAAFIDSQDWVCRL